MAIEINNKEVVISNFIFFAIKGIINEHIVSPIKISVSMVDITDDDKVNNENIE